MKYLLLILLSLTVNAKDIRIDITRTDGFIGSVETKEAAYPEYMKRLINHPSYRGEWKTEQAGYVLSKEVELEEGGTQTLYFIPSNFTISITDITADLAAEEQVRVDRLADIEAVKAINVDMIQGASPEVKQILKRLVKELK